MSVSKTAARIKAIRKHACVFKDDRDFLFYELEKRDKVIKLLADGIKMRQNQSALERTLEASRVIYSKEYVDPKLEVVADPNIPAGEAHLQVDGQTVAKIVNIEPEPKHYVLDVAPIFPWKYTREINGKVFVSNDNIKWEKYAKS